MQNSTDYTATYSPEDNKLRLYSVGRLPADVYAAARAHGFRYAPKQELFVAPAWTPDREDFLIELCGEIGDEDTSLVDRAAERAERFVDYSASRKQDAGRAHTAVSAIADHIPLGQPILVGHHSEKRARRDAERIENGMRRAVKMWEQAEYWQQRAAGALRAAKYKERADVRARRIKTLEADKRKQERTRDESARLLALWSREGLTHEQAVAISNGAGGWLSLPRKEGDRPDFNGRPTAYDALTSAHPTLYAPRSLGEIVALALPSYRATIERAERWIAHYTNRIAYERAMLDEQGGTVAERKGPEKGGAVRCWASPGYGKGWAYIQKVNKVSVSVLDNWGNGGGNFKRTIPFDKLAAVMTAAEVAEARESGRLHETADGCGFYLDEPAETRDEAKERAHREAVPNARAEREAEAAKFQALKEAADAGVKVVSAPQLFPTPPAIAARMAELAELEPGLCVLEPSAGTGNLVRAVLDRVDTEVLAYEINGELCAALARTFPSYKLQVRARDFLEVADFQGCYPRVIMNPPFKNGEDIKHIWHGFSMLAPGGRLVALCANGPRQREALKPFCDTWEDLPAGSFAEQGTGVNVALLVMTKEGETGRAPISGVSDVAEAGGGEDRAEPIGNATGEGARPEVVACDECGREFDDQDFLAAHRVIAHELADSRCATRPGEEVCSGCDQCDPRTPEGNDDPDPTGTDGGGTQGQSETKAEGAAAPRLSVVKRVKDADGARCRDCNEIFADFYPWHWRKSQALHEKGTGHRCDLVSILAPQFPIIVRHETEAAATPAEPAEVADDATRAAEQAAPVFYASADTLKALKVIKDARNIEQDRAQGGKASGDRVRAFARLGPNVGLLNIDLLARWVSLLPKSAARIEVSLETDHNGEYGGLKAVTLTAGRSSVTLRAHGMAACPVDPTPIELTVSGAGELTAPALPNAGDVKLARAELAAARKALRAESARQRAADQVHAARADVKRCEEYAEKLEAEARETIERADELTPEQCDEAVALAKRVRDLRRLQREVERAARDPQQRTAEQFAWIDAFRAAEYAGAVAETEKFERRGWHKKAETSRKRAAGILRSEFDRHTAAEVAEIAERVSPGYAEEYAEMAEYRAREIVLGRLSRHLRTPVQTIKRRLRELPREVEAARAAVSNARDDEREALEAYAPHVRREEHAAYVQAVGGYVSPTADPALATLETERELVALAA